MLQYAFIDRYIDRYMWVSACVCGSSSESKGFLFSAS